MGAQHHNEIHKYNTLPFHSEGRGTWSIYQPEACVSPCACVTRVSFQTRFGK